MFASLIAGVRCCHFEKPIIRLDNIRSINKANKVIVSFGFSLKLGGTMIKAKKEGNK